MNVPDPAPFRSVLFGGAGLPAPPDSPGQDGPAMPEFFRDLNLDQIVGTVTAGREEYGLAPFFYLPLPTQDAIAYRHEVFRDLEKAPIRAAITAFAAAMHTMRERLALAGRLAYPRQRERWFLDAAGAYCGAVTALAGDLERSGPASRGLSGARDYVAAYVASKAFTSLAAETAGLGEDLAAVAYCLHIKGNRVRVSRYGGEADYSAEVTATFEKFRESDVGTYLVSFPAAAEANHVEAGVLDLVAKLYPQTFAALTGYCRRHQGYLDEVIARFDREIQFYVACLEYAERLRAAGLDLCYPQVSRSTDIHAHATYDLALAGTLIPARPVVRNDLHLSGPERVLVVSGPNQGGKTTFARTFGQLHYLASLGCLVAGRDARLALCDGLFTHFEKQESLGDLSGKLQDDLVRIRQILERATPASIIIMNEIFTSTTLADAVFLARDILGRIISLGALCVCVTFLDELASLGPATVSMVSEVAPGDPAARTFKVVRRPADGLAHAMAIATRHGLTYAQLRGRVGP